MNSQLIRFTSGLLILGLLGSTLACSVKEAPPVIHQQPVETQTTEPKPATSSQTPPPDLITSGYAFDNLDLEKVHLLESQRPSAESVLSSTLRPLAAVLLSPSVYASSRRYDPKFFDALREFYAAIGYVNDHNPRVLKESGILTELRKVLYVDCDIDLKGTCPNLAVYSRESRFPAVVTLVVEQESDVLTYYSMLRSIYERYQARFSGNLDYLYLSRANDLSHLYINSGSKNSTLSSKSIAALTLHARLTQNILLNFDPNSVPKEKLDEIMRKFNPWDLSRKSSDILSFSITPLLNLAARGYLYADRKTGALNKDFKDKLDAILDSDEPVYGLGLQHMYNRLEKSSSAGILKNLGLLEPPQKNEYMYLVDRIFYSHFNKDDAEAFWKYTNRDSTALFKAVNQFLRLQIAYMVVWTNDQMNEFFQENVNGEKRLSIGDIRALLTQAVAKGLMLHAEWDNFFNGMNYVKNFVNNEYGTIDVLLLPKDDPYREMTDYISNLKENVKMLSVYPNMMMLVYLMAHDNLQMTIFTYSGPMSITSQEVIEAFFVKVFDPWFSFGTDGKKLSQIKLLYALHFTLQTETFSAYKDNPIFKVNAANFFKEITNKLSNSFYQQMIDRQNSLTTHLSAYGALIDKALSACEEEKVLQAQEAVDGKLRLRTYTRQIPYAYLNEQLANGFNEASDGSPLSAIASFYSVRGAEGEQLSNALVSIRSEMESRLLTLRNMKSILVEYLEETGGDVAGVTEAYNKEVSNLIDLRDDYLKRIYETVERIGTCDLVLYKHETDVRNAVYDREEAYLGQVYDQLTNLNSKIATEPTTAADEAAKLNTALIAGVKNEPKLAAFVQKGGNDHFRLNPSRGYYYDYYKFDSKLRVREWLRQISGGLIEVTLPEDLYQSDFAEYQSPKGHPLEPWGMKDRAQFIAEGMKQFVLNLDVESNLTPMFLSKHVNILAQLYRIGPVAGHEVTPEQIIDVTFQSLKLADTTDQDIRVLRWASRPQKFDDSFWDEFSMEKKSRRTLGLLDLAFQRVASDGDVQDGDMKLGIFTEAIEYYETKTAVGNFLIQPRDRMKKLIDGNYSDYVRNARQKTDAFVAAYRKLQKNDPYHVTKVRWAPNAYFFVPTETVGATRDDETGDVLPQYISTTYFKRQSALFNNFDARTANVFAK